MEQVFDVLIVFLVVAVICWSVTHFRTAYSAVFVMPFAGTHVCSVLNFLLIFFSFFNERRIYKTEKQTLIGKSRIVDLFLLVFVNKITFSRCHIRSLQEAEFRDIGLCR